ncbi:hypothetical protein HDK77DRAFT_14650 [Phyllosticta capitalensis]
MATDHLLLSLLYSRSRTPPNYKTLFPPAQVSLSAAASLPVSRVSVVASFGCRTIRHPNAAEPNGISPFPWSISTSSSFPVQELPPLPTPCLPSSRRSPTRPLLFPLLSELSIRCSQALDFVCPRHLTSSTPGSGQMLYCHAKNSQQQLLICSNSGPSPILIGDPLFKRTDGLCASNQTSSSCRLRIQPAITACRAQSLVAQPGQMLLRLHIPLVKRGTPVRHALRSTLTSPSHFGKNPSSLNLPDPLGDPRGLRPVLSRRV